ncbi:MAG: hypothetical protein ACREF7_02025, partial [Candidatus Saccharimonadales bacterium]
SQSAEALSEKMQEKLVDHRAYISENGVDMPEVQNWQWPNASH